MYKAYTKCLFHADQSVVNIAPIYSTLFGGLTVRSPSVSARQSVSSVDKKLSYRSESGRQLSTLGGVRVAPAVSVYKLKHRHRACMFTDDGPNISWPKSDIHTWMYSIHKYRAYPSISIPTASLSMYPSTTLTGSSQFCGHTRRVFVFFHRAKDELPPSSPMILSLPPLPSLTSRRSLPLPSS